MARPTFQPTEEHRRQVKKMSAVGMPHDVISIIVGITAKTLRKHFRHELTRGDAEGKLHIAAKLMQLVDAGNVTALIYMAKTRLGWRDELPVAAPASPPSFLVVVDSQTEPAKPHGRGIVEEEH